MRHKTQIYFILILFLVAFSFDAVSLDIKVRRIYSINANSTWNFEQDATDKLADGFEIASTKNSGNGNWTVIKDNGNNVFAQTDSKGGKYRFAMAVIDKSSVKNFNLSVKAKPITGEVDQTAGIVWRYIDPQNYYLLRSNALENNVRIYRIVNGNRVKLASKDEIRIKTNEWHTLKVEHINTHIKIYLNDFKLFDIEDRTFKNAGKIGLWIKADSITYFDDLVLEMLH